jgi:hypothetical protein
MTEAVETEVEKVERWRCHIAVENGCTPDDAASFAASKGDLHQLVGLIEQGCDPAVAVRILADL